MKFCNFAILQRAFCLVLLFSAFAISVYGQTASLFTEDRTIAVPPFSAILTSSSGADSKDLRSELQGTDDLFAQINTSSENPESVLNTNFITSMDKNTVIKNAVLKFNWVKEERKPIASAFEIPGISGEFQFLLLALIIIAAFAIAFFFFRRSERKPKTLLVLLPVVLFIFLLFTLNPTAQANESPVADTLSLIIAQVNDALGQRSATGEISKNDGIALNLRSATNTPADLVLGFQKSLPQYADVKDLKLRIKWKQEKVGRLPPLGQPEEPRRPITPPEAAVCGNSICEITENAQNCAVDCVPVCGNSVCEPTENNQNCPADCPRGRLSPALSSQSHNPVLLFEAESESLPLEESIPLQVAESHANVIASESILVEQTRPAGPAVPSDPTPHPDELPSSEIPGIAIEPNPLAEEFATGLQTLRTPVQETPAEPAHSGSEQSSTSSSQISGAVISAPITASVEYWEDDEWRVVESCSNILLPSEYDLFECDLNSAINAFQIDNTLKLAVSFTYPDETLQADVDFIEVPLVYAIELPGRAQASFYLLGSEIPLEDCQNLEVPSNPHEQSCNVTPYITSREQAQNLSFKTIIRNLQGKTLTKFDSIKLEFTYASPSAGIQAITPELLKQKVRLKYLQGSKDRNLLGFEIRNDDNTVDIIFDVNDPVIKTILINDLNLDISAYEFIVKEIEKERVSAPESTEWQNVLVVDPSGLAFNNAFIEGQTDANEVWKCKDFDKETYECLGEWVKVQDIENGEFILEVTAEDPLFGFGKPKPAIQFTRDLICHKCGQHKVPPTTYIDMNVIVQSPNPQSDAALIDYIPVDWIVIDPNGGVLSDYDSEFQKIEWAGLNFSGTVNRNYIIRSPERTMPATSYDFFTALNSERSADWRVIVADPATDVNLTVEGCTGGTTISSCSGMNTKGAATDITSTKNATANLGMNNGSYSGTFNSVKVWLNHSGASGISGTADIAMQSAAGTIYCAAVNTIANTTTFTLDSITACTPTGGWTVGKLDDLNVTVKNLDGGSATNQYLDYLTVQVNYTPYGTLSFSITNPSADNNTSVNQNVDFLVNGSTACNTNDCGSVDTNIQYCIGAGCSTWWDMNTATNAPLYIVSGSQPQNSTLTAGTSYNVSWVVQANTAQTYELRFWADGATADVNTTSGTDRTITIQSVTDLTFALALPSSGCTSGKGRTSSGNGACEKVYFETTDLTGNADENQVSPEGSNPFFVYDNQSTSSSDFNFTLDLNAALPATLFLKASAISTGYSGTCGGNPDNNCVLISTAAKNIGKAVYTTGSKDLNVWLWADFFASGIQTVDRNATSTSVTS